MSPDHGEDTLPTIYIIDDDSASNERLCRLFGNLGVTICTYSSAEAFMAAFLAKTPSQINGCLLTEVDLPGIDGIELIGLLRQRCSRIPVIVLAANSNVAKAVRAMQAGAVEFLTKPFAERVVLECVQASVEFMQSR